MEQMDRDHGVQTHNIPWKLAELKDGCILAGLAHAIMVAKYPFLANEHSWDGANYNVQDSEGQRGTITFFNGIVVAAFRNDNSERIARKEQAEQFFQGAPSEVLQVANQETLQFLLDEVDGTIRPFITAAFWGEGQLTSNDTVQDMLQNGASLLQRQLLPFEDALEEWKEFYEMNAEQVLLLRNLFDKKKEKGDATFWLSPEEISLIGIENKEGAIESRTSFEEMNIRW
jgi:hypothetical protein